MSLARVSPRVLTTVRSFGTTTVARDEISRNADQRQKQQEREAAKRKELRKLTLKKIAARQQPSEHPLYMQIPLALRFLRAAEAGNSSSQSVITVSTQVVSEKGAQALAGNISFPKPLKDVRIAVFTNDAAQAEIAKSKNVYLVGGSELVEQIKQGKVAVDFDKAFATPDMTGVLSSVARILGPKGLMPNAKKGTVAADISDIVSNAMGTVPFRQRGDSISVAVARCGFTDKEVLENVVAASNAFKDALANQKAKKPSILGETTLTSTHGPGLVIDFA